MSVREEPDPLLRNARVSSLSPEGFAPGATPGWSGLATRCWRWRSIPVEFTIGECRPVGEPRYDTLEAAQDYVRQLGAKDPEVGFKSDRVIARQASATVKASLGV